MKYDAELFLQLKQVVEATLFVSEKPMTVKHIWEKLSSHQHLSVLESVGGEVTQKTDEDVDALLSAEQQSHDPWWSAVEKDDVYQAVCQLQQDYEGRGLELCEVASGFRFQVRSEFAKYMYAVKEEKPPRYSRAVLETLSIIAYKQPITRAEIEEIRGVAVSSHIVKGLLEREWVRIVGHKEVPGRPALFATTKSFLDYFNLKSLENLPPLAEIKELGTIEKLEIEPQLGCELAQDSMVQSSILEVSDTNQEVLEKSSAKSLKESAQLNSESLVEG